MTEKDEAKDKSGFGYPLLGDVAISQVDFVYLMTQLDAIEILLREYNFKMYSRSSLEKMILSLKGELEKYVSNIA